MGFPEDEVVVSKKRLHNRIFAVSIFVALLMVVASYGVWWSGNGVQDAERIASDARTARAKAESDRAIEALKTQAESLKLEGDIARRDAAQAVAKAAMANERAEELRREAADLRLRATEAERAVIDLQRRMADRTITTNEQRDFIAVLRDEHPRVVIVSCLSDEESTAFANQLAEVIRAAGWTVPPIRGGSTVVPAPRGVLLAARSRQTPGFSALKRALETINIFPRIREDEHMPDGSLLIFVYAK